MKSFGFRLERVLTWRENQLSVAEAQAQRLVGDLRTKETAMAQLLDDRSAAQTTLAGTAVVSGAELGAHEASRIWCVREEKRLAARMSELQQSIETQKSCVAQARRGVKLVERLKQRQYESWKLVTDREVDELTAESAIAQWRRLNHR